MKKVEAESLGTVHTHTHTHNTLREWGKEQQKKL